MAHIEHSHLLSPIEVGPLRLSHRVVMAPLTRLRSIVPGDVPGPLMLDYYSQRASEGGFIISEATAISVTGRGYHGAPGIYSEDQVAGWKKITNSVHSSGGRMFLQLWHVGRTSHVEMTGGVPPVGPSVVPYEGRAFISSGWAPVSPNRALDVSEIPALLEDYYDATRRAHAAGFDGVEIHSGNGYLLDQFLQDGSNKRMDEYGGPPENRARLLLEVTRAVIDAWDSQHVAVRVSPGTSFNGMSDSNPTATFSYVAQSLNKLNLPYLHIIEPRVAGSLELADGLLPIAAAQMRQFFKGRIIAAGGFNADSAEAIIAKGDADLVAFGRHFIANPDLPRRIRLKASLNPYDRATFYGGDRRGYTDYPALADA
jgi:N-ethylmaleimide reductase